MTLRSMMDANLLEQCENEPVRIPGAIQPFGALLALDRQSLRIQNASENCISWFGIPAQELVGRPLSELFSEEEHEFLRQHLASENPADLAPLRLKSSAAVSKAHHSWELRAHEHRGVVFIEVESVSTTMGMPYPSASHRRIEELINALHRTKGLKELCDATARQVKELTGFDRVMIYRFDLDWHGTVVAEACSPHADSYLGLHFPASDIPAQARAIFLDNWLRMIPDVDYAPARIYPERHPDTGNPVDLGRTLLRSVSPIHLQYLRNMNVRASLTISLIKDGKLWGLIACHHNMPLFVDTEARAVATMIGQLASSQLHVKEAEEDLGYGADLKQGHRRLVTLLEAEEKLAEGLCKHSSQMLGLFGAQSGAIYYKDEWTTIGRTPSFDEMKSILAWLSEHMPANGIFHSDSLAKQIPEAAASKNVASGLVAIQLTKVEKNYILLFRPEVATTVIWAGAPDKNIVSVGGREVLHPRASFQSWKEVVEGKSRPWKAIEIDIAEHFRNSILSIALQQELRSEQAARCQAERLSFEKDEMVMVVAHDLRTPLGVISMCFEFLQRLNTGKDTAVERMIERGAYGARAMKTLISDILDVAKIEAGNLQLELHPEFAESMAEMAVDVFSPLAGEKNIHLLHAGSAENPVVLCEKNRVMQVFSNLIGNALKFTPHGGEIIVSTQELNGEVLFSVADTGFGISPENLPRIFERFWQAYETKQMGTGLGLWISKSIIEKHGGKIWASSKKGVGTTFSFSLPILDAANTSNLRSELKR